MTGTTLDQVPPEAFAAYPPGTVFADNEALLRALDAYLPRSATSGRGSAPAPVEIRPGPTSGLPLPPFPGLDRLSEEEPVDGRRSEQTYRAVAAAVDHGWADDQVRAAMADHPPTFERHGGDESALGADVDRCIEKVRALSTASSTGPARNRWIPMSISGYLDGTVVAPMPTILERSDGNFLLYPGKLTNLFGAPGSGKTWLAVLAAVQVVRSGGEVLWVDFETSPNSLAFRLGAVGLTVSEIEHSVHYVHMPAAIDADALSDSYLENFPGATLAVVDAATGLFASMGADMNDAVEADRVYSVLRGLTRHGVAVLLVDHSAKALGGGASTPLGSIRKSAAADVVLRVVSEAPMGAGVRGTSSVLRGKDRDGQIPFNANGAVGTLVVADDPAGGVVVELHPPSATAGTPSAAGEQKILDALRTYGPMSKSRLGNAAGTGNDTGGLVDAMEQKGMVLVERQGEGKAHTVSLPPA